MKRRQSALPSGLMIVLALCLLARPSVLHGQEIKPTGADSAAIVRTALDYIEGYYTGDTTRMSRALHPELAKRIVFPPREPGGKQTFNHMGAAQLIENTRR
ncbi:MAG: nuclear transport factor 2 family protein, partial [Gemmatimonadaceae bacterium]